MSYYASWIDVKRNIKDFSKDQLLDLIGDLYRLSANNKELFNARFSLLLMYEKEIQNVTELTPEKQKVFKNRLHAIMESASGIGWGYHDGLRQLYYESFPHDH